MIELALAGSIAVPLAVALFLAVWHLESERALARLALTATWLSAAAALGAVAVWLLRGARPAHTPPHVLFSEGDYRFTFALVLDWTSVTFLVLVQIISGMVMRFSRFYLHREPGFQRFFGTVLLFQAAMCLLTLAGNLDLMFAGWEMVGLSSFLLIAFYRERQSPARNALKTYSVYRVADIGMLLAACLEDTGGRREIGLLLLLAAMGKSAQFPFSFWVVRAMEGPTPSSALFYGALSVHAGAYLLLRTFDLWGGSVAIRICVGVVGIVTAILCSMFSRVQPTIKAHIGYASVTQVGLIFVEIACGLTTLALVHIASNAFLRCYQLLVSPSVVAHRLRQATAGATRSRPAPSVFERLMPEGWQSTLYVFALSEGYSKELLKAVLWFPLRRLGRALLPWGGLLLAVGVCAAAAALVSGRFETGSAALLADAALLVLAAAFSAYALALWQKPTQALVWASGSSLLVVAAASRTPGVQIGFGAVFDTLGIVLACAAGWVGLAVALSGRGRTTRFAGLWASRPAFTSCAFIGALGIAGFPALPTFWGEELILHSTLAWSRPFSVALAAVLALNGYLAVRNFAFVFFGHPEAESALASRAR